MTHLHRFALLIRVLEIFHVIDKSLWPQAMDAAHATQEILQLRLHEVSIFLEFISYQVCVTLLNDTNLSPK